MIVLFTDFGPTGPYTGQIRSVLQREAPGVPVIELLCDAPRFNPRAAAYLLAALRSEFPAEAVFLCVVDPGVGSASRSPVVVRSSDQWFVGPDNGLFNIVGSRGADVQWWEITWRPKRLSNTFHGRDLFAPVGAKLARSEPVPGKQISQSGSDAARWPQHLQEIIYIDHFGNAMTGIRASTLSHAARLTIGSLELPWARTFSDLPEGAAFWYENANGLVEIAVNQGDAARTLQLQVGTPVGAVAGSGKND